MTRTLIIVIVALVSLGLGYFIGTVKSSVDEKFAIVDNELNKLDTLQKATRAVVKGKEDFEDFIYKFISDSLFQLDRIKFPLKSSVQTGIDNVDAKPIKKENWKITRLFGPHEYKAQIYDNFERELRNTDERLFCWEGIENGINVEYRFSRINGLWYLVEYNDWSD